jgi:ABC-type transport system involved in cytochrome bd biosynthesis fused ATPase/permease subunit
MFDGINMQCGIYSLVIFIYLILSKLDIQLLVLIAIPLIFFLFLNYNNICFLGNLYYI